MPLDPQAKQVMEQLAALGFPRRIRCPQSKPASMPRRAPGRRARGRQGRTAQHSRPWPCYSGAHLHPRRAGPFPILVWFHGGGWVLGDLDSADPTARHLAVGAGCVVVSVDYRLAPETKFPGAADDCYAATQWAVQHAADHGDPDRIAVGGDSAGGNLAAAVSLMARDRRGPSLAFQLLVYPVTHCNYTTSSYQSFAEGYMLTRASMQWYWNHYLQDIADANNPYAAPGGQGSQRPAASAGHYGRV